MPLTPRESLITEGERAPDFTLLDQHRSEWTLSAALEQGDVVLCFYPLAFTDVCESEMCAVRDEAEAWQAKGATVVGISCDSFAVQKVWAEHKKFTHPLLADMKREVCRAYGLYWADLNVAHRGTVIVGKGADGSPVVKHAEAREPGNAMNFSGVLAKL